MVGWVLSTIKTLEKVPNLTTTCPEFRTFVETRVMKGPHANEYASLKLPGDPTAR